MKNASIGLKRAVERVSVDVMGSVGLSNQSLPEAFPQYEHVSSQYLSQTDALKSLRADAVAAFDAMARFTGHSHTLARRLREALPSSSPDNTRMAAEALLLSQASVADEVLSRVERRVKKRVIAPADEELEKAKEISARISARKKVVLDAQRYRARAADAIDGGDAERKAREKLDELTIITDELLVLMQAAIPRRASLLERAVAETIEFQRRFYVDAARLMDRCIDSVGQERLAAIRASGEDPAGVSQTSTQSHALDDDFAGLSRPTRRASQPSMPHIGEDDFTGVPRQTRRPSPPPRAQPKLQRSATSNGAATATTSAHTSLWDEDDDDDDDDPVIQRPHNPFDEDDDTPASVKPSTSRKEEHTSSSSTAFVPGFGTRESQKSYPSAGVGKRESVGGYPSSGVGSRESTGAYPTGGSRQRENSYPTGKTTRTRPPTAAPATSAASRSASATAATASKPPRRNRSEAEADLLNFEEPDTTSSTRAPRPKKTSAPPAAAATEDLLDLGSSKQPIHRSASNGAMEGDLLGDFGNVSAAAPTKSRSMHPTRQRNPAMSASSSAPSMPSASAGRSNGQTTSSSAGESLEREQLRLKHEAEIKARADEKLAAVRERERAEEKERDQKDTARGAAEAKVNQWMGNGARRGNLRALLASLDTVLYPGATWTAVDMTVLKANPKVKINYHKAILQVHPDKIGSKNLPPDQQVLAELIFDELKNAYEVWTAEQDGRPPPPGSVGPKRAPNSGGPGPGFGNMGGMGRAGMFNNMGGMGRGGMGMGGMGMGGMGRAGMGGMGGMGMGGMGNMGRGMGMGGMGGMGPMGGRGMGGMYGAGTGRRGTGMGNMPQGFGTGRNTQTRR